MRRVVTAIVVAVLASPGASIGGQGDRVPASLLLGQAQIKRALAAVRQDEPRVIEDQIELSEVAAPLMKETRRGEMVRRKFEELGLANIRTDAAGNVLGDRPGRNRRPHLVLAAHLDTVFPEGTSVHVTREAGVIKGPGIADDARGLAVMLGVARALRAANVQTRGTITFVADVGEEGLGDLRGMKAIFDRTLKNEVDYFVSIDGADLDITNGGTGSHRYRVTYTGPGGHSYGDFGLANPIHALGRAMAHIADLQVPSSPRTTFSVGRVGGGTSVNSIAHDAWMEVDMRSVNPAALNALDASFRKAIDRALEEENARWGDRGHLSVEARLVGDRPAGLTPETSVIVVAALDVTRALGNATELGVGSTDANYPMSLGIPAITIGGGGVASGAHSLSESFDTAESWRGTERALVLAVALVGRAD